MRVGNEPLVAGSDKLEYIDAIRGVAILAVIVVHTSQATPSLPGGLHALCEYGQMGVQLFFVASAYTLCLAYQRHPDEKHKLSSFFVKRFCRIAPLYYLAICLYFLVSRLQGIYIESVFPFGPYKAVPILANVFFLHGFIAEGNNTIVPGGWSIGTEMAFYALFPALFAFCIATGGVPKGRATALIVLSLVLSAGWQARVLHVTGRPVLNNSFYYLNLVNQLPVFCLGIYAYFRDKERVGPSPWFYSLAGAVLLTVFSLLLWKKSLPFAFTLIPVVSGLSFVCLMEFFKQAPRLWPVLGPIGRASYSMYIFHFLFAWYFFRPYKRMIEPYLGATLTLATGLVLVSAVTFAIARLSVRWIENPAIRAGRRWLGRHQAQAGRGSSDFEARPCPRHTTRQV